MKSSKQKVIARSTMKSKFIALDKCGEEEEWLCHFLEDIPRWPKAVPPICIYCDMVEHKTICTMVSLDTFVVDTIPLDNYSQLGLSLYIF